MQVREISFSEAKDIAKSCGVIIPIEQTQVWSKYQSTINGRSQWQTVLVEDGDTAVCFANFLLFETHGFNFLRSCHGPVWFGDRDEDVEKLVIEAITNYVKTQDKSVVFIRMAVMGDFDICEHVLSTTPYDTTVVVDVEGDEEDVLMRMKPRGRRDVRKALREAPIVCVDETDMGLEDFTPYYKVMLDTCERDGFVPAVQSDYENMLTILGKDHARLFAARDEQTNELAGWGIFTMNDSGGVYYYAAGSSEYRKKYPAVNDKLVFKSLMKLSELGCKQVDLMGIGSDLCPELNGLNLFKTKFSKKTVSIAPDRDIPVRGLFYKSLVKARKVLRRG